VQYDTFISTVARNNLGAAESRAGDVVSMRHAIATILDGLLLIWILIGPICWILRDGLGPDSVASHGLHAVVRFLLTFYWGALFAALAIL
jgi:hypothetical protein